MEISKLLLPLISKHLDLIGEALITDDEFIELLLK